MIFQANHGLPSRQSRQRRSYGSDGFNQSCMHAAMHDSIRLMVLWTDFHLCNHFISSSTNEMDSHGKVPTAVGSVERIGKVTVG